MSEARPVRLILLIAATPAIERATQAAWGDRVLMLAQPPNLELLPDHVAMVVVCRDHPDRFRDLSSRLRRRWPLAESLVVGGPWTAAAGHTRRDVPPAMRATEAEAIARIEAVGHGDSPQAWPDTLTRTDTVLARDQAWRPTEEGPDS